MITHLFTCFPTQKNFVISDVSQYLHKELWIEFFNFFTFLYNSQHTVNTVLCTLLWFFNLTMFLRNLLYQFIEIFIIHFYIATQYSTVWMYNNLFTEALIVGKLGCLQSFPNTNNDAMNTLCCSEHCHFISEQLNV